MSGAANELVFECVLLGAKGTVQLVVRVGGDTFSDKVAITDAKKRAACLERLVQKFPGVPAETLEAELERVGADVAKQVLERNAETTPSSEAVIASTDADLLVQFALKKGEVTLSRVGARHDAEAYATIIRGGHAETYAIKSSAFGYWLRECFYTAYKRPPASQAFSDAINMITSLAIFQGEELKVYVRIAGHGASIYIDLCDGTWRVIEINATGWRVISNLDCPVCFVRRRGMKALPEPTSGGSIVLLRRYVNCPTEDLWILFVGTLTSLLNPRGPYVVLVVSGEQGSGKSWTSKRARDLVDPNIAPVRRLPREDRDLMIAANNAFILIFDNLSTIPPSVSDALCSLATGGGFSARQLYSDDEEKLIDARRPIVLNGIEDFASRPDLLDRAVVLKLPHIPEEQRREERELEAEFERDHPLILGALLDAVSTALRRFDSVVLTRKPRMLDFARWCTAAEEAFGWKSGTFLDAYMRNRGDAVAIAIESSAVGPPVLALMQLHERWKGSASVLLMELEAHYTDDRTRKRKDWPTIPRALTDALTRIAPALRALGVNVDTGGRENGGNRDRFIILTRVPRFSGTDEPDKDSGPEDTRDADERGDHPDGRAFKRPAGGIRDGRDGRDGRVADSPCRDSNSGDGDADENDSFDGRDEVSASGNAATRPSLPSLDPHGDPEEAELDRSLEDGPATHETDAPDDVSEGAP